MICAHYVKAATSDNATWLDRAVEGPLSPVIYLLIDRLRRRPDPVAIEAPAE